MFFILITLAKPNKYVESNNYLYFILFYFSEFAKKLMNNNERKTCICFVARTKLFNELREFCSFQKLNAASHEQIK